MAMFVRRRDRLDSIETVLIDGFKYTALMLSPNTYGAGAMLKHFLEGFAAGTLVTLSYVWLRLGAVIQATRTETIKHMRQFQETLKGE
jgi:hypothetical protein